MTKHRLYLMNILLFISTEDARVKFKEYVNQLATTKTEDNERYVIIRKRYIASSNPPLSPSPTGSIASPSRQPPPYRPPPDVKSPTHSVDSFRDDASLDNVSQCSEYSLRSNMTCDSFALGCGDGPPQVPPRRKSQEKLKTALFPVDNVENVNNNQRNKEDANNNSSEDVVKSVVSFMFDVVISFLSMPFLFLFSFCIKRRSQVITNKK